MAAAEPQTSSNAQLISLAIFTVGGLLSIIGGLIAFIGNNISKKISTIEKDIKQLTPDVAQLKAQRTDDRQWIENMNNTITRLKVSFIIFIIHLKHLI